MLPGDSASLTPPVLSLHPLAPPFQAVRSPACRPPRTDAAVPVERAASAPRLRHVPHPRFDETVHEPTRLRICTELIPHQEVAFEALAGATGVTVSSLSKHLAVLEAKGYLVRRKRTVGRHTRTFVSLTAPGRDAFCGHVSELQRIATIVRRAERRQSS